MSFARLFRSSRLVAADQAHRQVFQASSEATMKRNLPHAIQTEYFHLDEVDSKYGHTRIQDAEANVLRYEFAMEHFTPAAVAQTKQRPTPLPNVNELSEDEFQRVVAEARAKRHEFKERVGEATVRRHDPKLIEDMLHVRLGHDSLEQRYPCELTYGQRESSSTKEDAPCVPGRVLNPVRGGYAVGLGGMVAFLPDDYLVLHPSFNPEDRSKVHQFYVRRVRFNAQGQPHIIVALEPTARSAADTEPKVSQEDMVTREARLKALLDDVVSSVKVKDRQPSAAKTGKGLRPRKSGKSAPVVSDQEFMDSLADFLDSFGSSNGSDGNPDKKK